jgi:hypothetical protein
MTPGYDLTTSVRRRTTRAADIRYDGFPYLEMVAFVILFEE